MSKSEPKSYPNAEDMFYSLPAVRRWVANKSEHCVIKELERLTNPDEIPVQIQGRVLEGIPTVGSYCKLDRQEGLYEIAKIGYAGNLAAVFAEQTTKFTLKMI